MTTSEGDRRFKQKKTQTRIKKRLRASEHAQVYQRQLSRAYEKKSFKCPQKDFQRAQSLEFWTCYEQKVKTTIVPIHYLNLQGLV